MLIYWNKERSGRQVASAWLIPALAKNARMGHPTLAGVEKIKGSATRRSSIQRRARIQLAKPRRCRSGVGAT